MAGETNNPLDFADDKISEIERKISQKPGSTQKHKEIYARINGISPSQEAPAPDSSTTTLAEKAPINVPQNTGSIKSLRTFQGDVAEAIKQQNASVLTIAFAEKRRQENVAKPLPRANVVTSAPQAIMQVVPQKEKKTADPQVRKNILMIALSILLIAFGIGSVAGFYYLQKKQTDPITKEERSSSILGWSKKETLMVEPLKRDSLIDAIYTKRQVGQIGEGEILYIEFVGTIDQFVTTQEFFSILKSKAPASLLRAFGNTFMFGFFKTNGNNVPFLLVRLESFERAFNGMLSWEKILFEDIGSLFSRDILPIYENTKANATTTSTSTEPRILTLTSPDPQGFLDEAIRNKDARVLKSTRGETILLYSFLDKETLLITSHEAVLQELINKLVSQKLIR